MLAVASSAPGENFQKVMAAFKAKYPFLEIANGFYSGPTGRMLARVNAEMDAKRLTFDVMLRRQHGGLDRHDPQRPDRTRPVARLRCLSGACEDGRLLGGCTGDRRHSRLQRRHPVARRCAENLARPAAPALRRQQDGDPECRSGHAVQLELSAWPKARTRLRAKVCRAAAGGDGDRRADDRRASRGAKSRWPPRSITGARSPRKPRKPVSSPSIRPRACR